MLFAAALGWNCWASRSRRLRLKAQGTVLVSHLQDPRRQYGTAPPLSQAQSLEWSDSRADGEGSWTLFGTLRSGQEPAVFDGDGVQATGGDREVTYAFGSPWWTPPPD